MPRLVCAMFGLLALSFAPDGSLWAVEEPGVLRHWNTVGGRQLAWHFLSEFEMLWAFSDNARWLVGATGLCYGFLRAL